MYATCWIIKLYWLPRWTTLSGIWTDSDDQERRVYSWSKVWRPYGPISFLLVKPHPLSYSMLHCVHFSNKYFTDVKRHSASASRRKQSQLIQFYHTLWHCTQCHINFITKTRQYDHKLTSTSPSLFTNVQSLIIAFQLLSESLSAMVSACFSVCNQPNPATCNSRKHSNCHRISVTLNHSRAISRNSPRNKHHYASKHQHTFWKLKTDGSRCKHVAQFCCIKSTLFSMADAIHMASFARSRVYSHAR